jgi:hypothetical protein
MALFKKRTLESLTADLSNTVAALEQLTSDNHDAVLTNDAEIQRLRAESDVLNRESERATRIAGRITELLS